MSGCNVGTDCVSGWCDVPNSICKASGDNGTNCSSSGDGGVEYSSGFCSGGVCSDMSFGSYCQYGDPAYCNNRGSYDPPSGTCSYCYSNYDPSTMCSTCLPGYDPNYDCYYPL